LILHKATEKDFTQLKTKGEKIILIKAQKFLTSVLCVSMAVSNITPVFATVTNDTLAFEDTDTTALEQTEVLYEKAGSYFVTIPKIISLGADKQSPYSVKVEGDIPSDKQVYVSPIDGIKDTEDFDFYMHDQSAVNPKADVVATVTQNKFYWNFSEVADGYAETNNQVTAEDLTSGAWKGTFDFEINMHKVEPERPDFTLTTDGDVTIPIGGTHQLNAYIDGVESNSDVLWSCNNEDVTINNGLIELPSDLEAGSELIITVAKDGKEVSLIITVSEPVPDFTLTTDGDVTIPIGETLQLNAYIDGVESNSNVEWSCDNEDVIISNGLIELPSTLTIGSKLTITVTKGGKETGLTVTVGKEDAVEIKDWIYTLDDENKTITLKQYIGSDTDVIVHNKYKAGDTFYKTKIASNILESNGHYSTEYMFAYKQTIKSIKFEDKIDFSETFNMANMFHACTSLTSLDLSNVNTTNVADMSDMFQYCCALTDLDLSSFNTSNVTKMRSMFYECTSLTNLNISNFDTSSVTDMDYMFYKCTSLANLDLSKFDTSNVMDMNGMFYNCASLTSLDLSNLNTSNVTDMGYMFDRCTSLIYLDVSNFNTINVTKMDNMFGNCTSLTSLDLSSFDTTNVTNMYFMFGSCISLTSLNLSSFNIGNVTNMDYMFYGCTNLETIYVTNGKWSTSQANAKNMFTGCGTSSVTYK